MPQSKLPVIERTVHDANTWLSQIADEMNHPDHQMAYHALRGVLFSLRDRLPITQALQLGSQLPTLIRGFYYESYKAAGKSEKFDRNEFLKRVGVELDMAGGANPEEAVAAVLGVLSEHVDEGEVHHLQDVLPESFVDLWPQEMA